jgi:hypothetical protein
MSNPSLARSPNDRLLTEPAAGLEKRNRQRRVESRLPTQRLQYPEYATPGVAQTARAVANQTVSSFSDDP